MKKPRLIAVDVDGTLLDDAKRLPPENREALREAADRGIVIAIASGRMVASIERIQDLLGIDCVLVAYNGALIVGRRSEGRPVIAHRPLPADVAALLIEFSRDEGYLLNFYHEDRLYAEDGPRRRPLMDLYARRTGIEYHIVADLRRFLGVSPTKAILLAEPEERERLQRHFAARLEGRAFVTRSEPEYLEFMAHGVDKGAGLREMARHCGLEVDEVMGVGDAENDIGLIRSSGWGVAVANAAPGVKAVARAVTERTNGEGAVAEAVRRWVLDGSPSEQGGPAP